ncbi:MAG TPA: hypothetical protein VGC41_21615 [Kofleriaceae bacterium]
MQLKPLVAIVLTGCLATPTESVETDDLGVTRVCATPTLIDHSLASRDATVLQRFSFARTMTQIRNSMPGGTETVKQMYQTWMASYGNCSDPRIDPNHYGIVCPRPEQILATVDPTDPASPVQFVPTGVFNRFDLAPTNGQNCGEYRISYQMSFNNVVSGLAFLIFEGVLPNPHPEQGIDGCRPIAQWWKQRSNDASPEVLADNLEKFFYLGTAVPGVRAVVNAQSYGMGQHHNWWTPGQIRANMFVNSQQWNLREFKTSLNLVQGEPIVTIDQVTVKNNPANEVIDGSSPASSGFRSVFALQVSALAAPSVATVSDSIDDGYNEWESVSSGNVVVNYDNRANADMRAAIQTKLDALGITDLGPTEILRRTTSQTCAGCHEVSTVGLEGQIGRGQTWPGTLPFIHVVDGGFSPALRGVFLPYRQTVLDAFLCGPHTVVDDGLTVGGAQVGAAN